MSGDRSEISLLRNSAAYEACLSWVESLASEPERCLHAISRTALLAWSRHPGRFADGALENWALGFGRTEPIRPAQNVAVPSRWSAQRSSKTLHVASELHPVGGHTRVLAKWVAGDVTANHMIVLTRQHSAVPEFFERAVAAAGGIIVCLPPSDSVMHRAATLRDLAIRFERVVLHTHPDDPIPIVAFAPHDGPPVAMFNHAHFSFSLGPTVSDLVVNSLDYFREISGELRFARQTACLTGVPGISQATRDPIDKAAAKAAIGLHQRFRLVLAVAQEPYFRPIAGYDFFRTARKLIDRNGDMHLLVVGVPAESPLVPSDLRREARCHFMGPVIDPIPYYRAADVCLESFPMPSLGSVIESVVYGEAFPVPVYGATESIVRVSLRPVLHYAYRPSDEDDYVTYVSSILSQLPARREQSREARLQIISLDEEWAARLADLNRRIDTLTHQPTEIPKARMIDSYDCRVLADLRTLDLGAASVETDDDRHWKAFTAVLEDPDDVWSWTYRVNAAARDIVSVVPNGQAFILVDQDELRQQIASGLGAVPFLEREGKYWGEPADDEAAIRELDRLKQNGAACIVIAWPAFWWLDFYSGFNEYLRSTSRCVLENDRLIVFDLRS